jgi:hypothetical protein
VYAACKSLTPGHNCRALKGPFPTGRCLLVQQSLPHSWQGPSGLNSASIGAHELGFVSVFCSAGVLLQRYIEQGCATTHLHVHVGRVINSAHQHVSAGELRGNARVYLSGWLDGPRGRRGLPFRRGDRKECRQLELLGGPGAKWGRILESVTCELITKQLCCYRPASLAFGLKLREQLDRLPNGP